jgi:ubiquinol-cytochrome c reductase cytochrome c1 subunit
MGRHLMKNIAIVGSVCLLGVFVLGSEVRAAGDQVKPPSQKWSFTGLFGTFDRNALQRGFQVYNEVCAGCHSLRLVAYRNLMEIGFTEDQVKTIAAEKEVQDGPNDEGEMFDRPARPSDRFVSPFPNDNAARAANNGAFPPDLSLIVKARKNGANYLHALMTGYKDPPAGTTLPEGMAYNEYFPGKQISMPSPLSDDGVEYADKTKATVDQMSRDVTVFLAWAAEPELEARKAMGVKVLLFLLVLTGLLYAVKRKIWADVH